MRVVDGLALTLFFLPALLPAQTDWAFYGNDPGGTRYSNLSQITPRNVATLQPVWTYDPGETTTSYEVTPLVIGDVMYASTPNGRVVALDAENGHELWSFDMKVRPNSYRGVSYWPGDKQTPPRIVAATTDGRLFEIDAKSGKAVTAFGDNGMVNLRAGVADNYPNALYGISSPPAIFHNLIILGPRTQEGGAKGPLSDIRAFDAFTGKTVWEFRPLPRPGEPGYETWGPDFWKDGAGPSAWAPLSFDAERGLIFVPTGNPAGGGDPAGRKGMNLFSNCLVALDAATGKMKWYYQMVHHDVWDYDVTAQPTLVDVVKGGTKIPAVAQITKQGLLFILNRITGEPVFGAEEREVAKAQPQGDELWPTQPFPLKPPPLARMTMTADEVSKISPESQKFCSEMFASRVIEGPFSPKGAKPSIQFPSSIGGGNWGGVAFDPSRALIFVNTSDLGGVSGGNAPSNRFVDQDHYPCNQPPWGALTAVNANTGDIAWRVPLGSYKELEAKGIFNAGAGNMGGPLATASGLVFIGATDDFRFRAFDSQTGKQLWMIDLDGDALASPITFSGKNGRQYLAIVTGGPSYLNGVGPQRSNIHGKIAVFGLPDAAK